MATPDRQAQHPFLAGFGLSRGEMFVMEELMESRQSGTIHAPNFDWLPILNTMFRYFGDGVENQDRIIQCHKACAIAAPCTYRNLAELVLKEAFERYSKGMWFSSFWQYSVIGILDAGAVLQITHQSLIGDNFECKLATFIRRTIPDKSGKPSWTSLGEGKGTLHLMDAAMKRYFRPQDHIACQLLLSEVPKMIFYLKEDLDVWGPEANATLVFNGLAGPGTEMLRSLIYGVLDIERRDVEEQLRVAEALYS